MDDRASGRDRLRRAAASCDQLFRLEKTRVAKLERELAEIDESARKAIEMLGAGVLAPTLMERQLVMLACRRLEIEAARAARCARAMQLGRQAKLIEDLVKQREISLRRKTAVAELRRLAQSPNVSAP